MNKKQILCTGLSLALLLSTSVVTTPASIAAGKYFKIQYTHSKKKVKKKAINARYNNNVDRKSTRLNSSHIEESRMPSSA